MNKEASGGILVAGLFMVCIAFVLPMIAPSDLDPTKDWLVDTLNYSAIAVGGIGLVLFFFGAMRFSRGS